MLSSIILLNWNTTKETIEAMESLKNQTEKNFETVLIDNNSKPEDVALLDEYYKKNRDELKINYVKNKENIGFAGGCNSGISIAKGDIMVFLNNDAVAEPQWLEKLIEPFKRDNKVGATGSKVIYYHEKDKRIVQFAGSGRLTIYGAAICDMIGKPDDFKVKDEVETAWVMGAAFAVSKEILNKLGEWLCNYYFAYYEEVDLSWRIASAGYKLIYCPDSVVYHKGSISMKINNTLFRQQRLTFRNKYLTFWRNLPVHQFLITLPFLVTYDSLRCVKYISKGAFDFPKAYIFGIKDFLFSLNKVRKPRQGKLSYLSLN